MYSVVAGRLRGYKAAAPLKRKAETVARPSSVSPRLQSRGPIEAVTAAEIFSAANAVSAATKPRPH